MEEPDEPAGLTDAPQAAGNEPRYVTPPGDGPEVTDGTNAIELASGSNVYSAEGGAGDDDMTGDDTIRGGGGDDYVYGGTGADTIKSGDGNDSVYTVGRQRDAGVDRVDCGGGDEDVVYIQRANADRVANCEKIHLVIRDDY